MAGAFPVWAASGAPSNRTLSKFGSRPAGLVGRRPLAQRRCSVTILLSPPPLLYKDPRAPLSLSHTLLSLFLSLVARSERLSQRRCDPTSQLPPCPWLRPCSLLGPCPSLLGTFTISFETLFFFSSSSSILAPLAPSTAGRLSTRPCRSWNPGSTMPIDSSRRVSLEASPIVPLFPLTIRKGGVILERDVGVRDRLKKHKHIKSRLPSSKDTSG